MYLSRVSPFSIAYLNYNLGQELFLNLYGALLVPCSFILTPLAIIVIHTLKIIKDLLYYLDPLEAAYPL